MVAKRRGLLLKSELLAGVAGRHESAWGGELVFQRNERLFALAVGRDFSQTTIYHVDGNYRPPAVHSMAIRGQIPASTSMCLGEHWINGFSGRRGRGNTEARN